MQPVHQGPVGGNLIPLKKQKDDQATCKGDPEDIAIPLWQVALGPEQKECAQPRRQQIGELCEAPAEIERPRKTGATPNKHGQDQLRRAVFVAKPQQDDNQQDCQDQNDNLGFAYNAQGKGEGRDSKPEVWCIGLTLNRLGSCLQFLQMYS